MFDCHAAPPPFSTTSPGSRSWFATRLLRRRRRFTASSKASWPRPAALTGTGTGGSGRKLKAEFSKENHVRGTVSMARAPSPDSGDSQSLCALPTPWLDGQYTVWGKVTEGMQNIDKIKRESPYGSLTVSSPPSCKRQPDRGAAGDLRPRLSRSAPVRAPRHPWRTIHAWFGRPDKR